MTDILIAELTLLLGMVVVAAIYIVIKLMVRGYEKEKTDFLIKVADRVIKAINEATKGK
jgi:hypothetical protein